MKRWVISGLFFLFAASKASALDCSLYQQANQCAVNGKHPVHLSFDDGPADVTHGILDILQKEQVKATFFIIASKIDCAPKQQACDAGDQASCHAVQQCYERHDILQRAKNEGHMIGSHSYHHIRHSHLPVEQLRQHIRDSRELLEPYLTTNPPLFRLPYGDGWFNRAEKPHVLNVLREEGFSHVAWEMSAYDWRKSDQQGDKILQTALNEICTKKKGIILFHDGVHNQEHIGRKFTADNMNRWLPAMKCVADFKPLSFFRNNVAKVLAE